MSKDDRTEKEKNLRELMELKELKVEQKEFHKELEADLSNPRIEEACEEEVEALEHLLSVSNEFLNRIDQEIVNIKIALGIDDKESLEDKVNKLQEAFSRYEEASEKTRAIQREERSLRIKKKRRFQVIKPSDNKDKGE